MASNYPNGFSGGVTIRGVPLHQAHPGEVFYVNNSSVLAKGGVGGSNGNDGSYRRPFSTIDYAIGKCSAGRGDVIYVMPGHAETVISATTIAAGVAVPAVMGIPYVGWLAGGWALLLGQKAGSTLGSTVGSVFNDC